MPKGWNIRRCLKETDVADDLQITARELTRRLIDHLVDITEAAERDPRLDLLSEGGRGTWFTMWLDDMPTAALGRRRDEELLRVSPPIVVAQPAAPPELHDWLDPFAEWTFDGDEPVLLQTQFPNPDPPIETKQPWVIERGTAAPPESVVRLFNRWLQDWREWSEDRRKAEKVRPVYEFLETAAKTIEQKDDEYEFVMARCLVRWVGPDGRTIRRHLITDQVQPTLERGSADAVVTQIGLAARFEDGELFRHVEAYDGERAPDAREQIKSELRSGNAFEHYGSLLGAWLYRVLQTEVRILDSDRHDADTGTQLEITESPALILRPRPKTALAEAYKGIRKELAADDSPTPVALAQLVIDTEAEQRQNWIEMQGAVSGDVLGEDPRFPLDANEAQQRVMELLRTETTVVVQGPPGTGKTHTIANLMAALLARGQRVLVTSQKDQALRVLREKVPAELRRLCVLMAGGGKDAAKELQQSLEALSDALASSDPAALHRRVTTLTDERVALRVQAERLNREIRDLRDVEFRRYDDVTPWSRTAQYQGSLAEIVQQVHRHSADFAWFLPATEDAVDGPPPLANHEALELHRLLLHDVPERRARLVQWIPHRTELPALADFVNIIDTHNQALEAMTASETGTSRRLSSAAPESLDRLDQLRSEVIPLLINLGYGEEGAAGTVPDWVDRALSDGLNGRSRGLWRTVQAVDGEASRLLQRLQEQGLNYQVDMAPVAPGELGSARGDIAAGEELLRHLQHGGKFRRHLASRQQRNAASFLLRVKVNGGAPTDADSCAAALGRLEAEVATAQLVEMWADCGVNIALGRVHSTLSELADASAQLARVGEVLERHQQTIGILGPLGLGSAATTTTGLIHTLKQVEAALSRLRVERLAEDMNSMLRRMRTLLARADACPEVAPIASALSHEDGGAYRDALASLDIAAEERADAERLQELAKRLEARHPRLLALLRDTSSDEQWPDRLTELDAAWSWQAAQRFVINHRTAERERELATQFMRIEDQIQSVTSRLAATEAMIMCLERMTDAHVRALRTYREQMQHVGSGYGRNDRKHREAARAAMEKAKSAVPAWVVPLSTLLDNIPPERNSFDVVIVDEASQVGMEQLYLLWLAPRVIVVGDDKQCTPGQGRLGGHDRIQASIDRHLRDVDADIRMNFGPKTNLYGLLSARSGRDAVIRLREHFRCVPEIINWSSTQFYGSEGAPGLIALRERSADDLPPLMVRHVPDAYTEGKSEKLHNPVEAKTLADQLAACVADPRYAGKTFGVVVLQGRRQVQVLDHEIAARISPEQRTERKIRVGLPSDFQGDERNIIFLSMVVGASERRPRAQRALMFQQSYNVAASRAEDQLWLFTSVKTDELNPDDLRSSLLGYMLDPPSTYGPSPDLDAVSDDIITAPFESLFEQRVFREIRKRGYHVVPQYPVGSRHLDLVIVGDGARVAVECDGHRFHTSPEDTDSDARRDRELHRMKWEVVRIRESESPSTESERWRRCGLQSRREESRPGHYRRMPQADGNPSP